MLSRGTATVVGSTLQFGASVSHGPVVPLPAWHRAADPVNLFDQDISLLGKEQIAGLEKRDNEVYRAIFEATPIPDSARLKEMEKSKEIELVQGMSESELVKSLTGQLNTLSLQVAYQNKSYNEIDGMIKDKQKLLAAIPAIQPVSNKDLRHIASGFGYRVDPVYKITKFHAM
jgi:hypothetical protein